MLLSSAPFSLFLYYNGVSGYRLGKLEFIIILAVWQGWLGFLGD
jgi:hypothetical protein